MTLSWRSWFSVKTRQTNRRICLDAGLRLLWGFKCPSAPVELRASALIDWFCSRSHPPPRPQPVHGPGGQLRIQAWFCCLGPISGSCWPPAKFCSAPAKTTTTKAQCLGKNFSRECRSLCTRRSSSKEIDAECMLPSFFWSIARKRDRYFIFLRVKKAAVSHGNNFGYCLH